MLTDAAKEEWELLAGRPCHADPTDPCLDGVGLPAHSHSIYVLIQPIADMTKI